MVQDAPNSSHAHFCATRNPRVSAFFVAVCGTMLLLSLRSPSARQGLGKGMFVLVFEAYALVLIGLLFLRFRCVRERAILGLAMLTPIRILIFGFAPTIGFRFAGLAGWCNLAVWSTAFTLSVTMLGSALRAGHSQKHVGIGQ